MSKINEVFSGFKTKLLADNSIMFNDILNSYATSVADLYRSMPHNVVVDGKKLTVNVAEDLVNYIKVVSSDQKNGRLDGSVFLQSKDAAMDKDGRIFETYSPYAPFKLTRFKMRNQEFLRKICVKTYPDIEVRVS